ncbi:MAG TPA: LysR family transcriptional regulator [Candidatus Limnocylindrales bacterium]|nr:LysR family transcriptional regulator [Candidatus Limnocylindrales bacterium]
MNTEGLKLFVEIASRGSISKVAESTHFSQPAISQQIKRLEESLGYDLFTRSNKGVQLTEAGVIVLKYAKIIIRSYENMLEDLSVVENSASIIRLNCTPIIATYALPCTVYSINNHNATRSQLSLKLELYTSHSEEVETNIINDTFDLGIIISKPKLQSLAADFLTVDAIIPVTAAKYKLDQEMTVEKLTRENLILPAKKFGIKEHIRKWFSNEGYELESLKTVSDMEEIESIKSTVIKGYGVSLLPYLTIKKELYTKQLQKINIKDFELSYDIYLIYKESRLSDLNFREFVKMFKKRARKTFC